MPGSPARALGLDPAAGALIEAMAAEAEAIFASGAMMCAPAVLTVLNRTLDGGLPPGLDKALAAALPEGLGGSGCLCGALGGAQLALGLFLGPGLGGQRRARRAGAELADAFKDYAGATCCRVLSRPVRDDKKAHMAKCARLTGTAAGLAAGIILARRPELAAANHPTPSNRTRAGRLKRLAAAVLG